MRAFDQMLQGGHILHSPPLPSCSLTPLVLRREGEGEGEEEDE